MTSTQNNLKQRTQSHQRAKGLGLTKGTPEQWGCLQWQQQSRVGLKAWAPFPESPPALLCLSGPTNRWLLRPCLLRTHGSCRHDPHCCPARFPCSRHRSVPAAACQATGPSGPFAGLKDVPSGLFSLEGNWGLKAQCGWNDGLWAQHKRGGKRELLRTGISPSYPPVTKS